MDTEYDFAFSFANEDRAIVEQIKNGLPKFKVFYDQDCENQLCGKDLYSHLKNIYQHQAKFVVCFFSRHYKQKIWTNLEFAAVKERLLSTCFASDFLIPVVLDNSGLNDDIPSFIGYHRYENPEKMILFLKEKINQSLNEDYYLDNISKFKEYVLQELVKAIQRNGFDATYNEKTISLLVHETDRSICLQTEHFTNLPCLILLENERDAVPLAIITWKRDTHLRFILSDFTDISRETVEDLSFNRLIEKLTDYLLYGEY
mgnify:CR=1 FL=1